MADLPTNPHSCFFSHMCVCNVASVVSDSATVWTVALQAPLSMGFSRQEYWGGLPCLPPRDLPDPGIEPVSLMSPELAGATWEIPQCFVQTRPAHLCTVMCRSLCPLPCCILSSKHIATCHTQLLSVSLHSLQCKLLEGRELDCFVLCYNLGRYRVRYLEDAQ